MFVKNSILIVVDSCAWRRVTAAPRVASRPAAAQRWRFSELVRSGSFAVVYGSGSAHMATVVIHDHKDRSHTVERYMARSERAPRRFGRQLDMASSSVK